MTREQQFLQDLETAGVTPRALERALSLPVGEVDRWKTGERLTSEVRALLRILESFPWMIGVAASGYSHPHATGALVAAAGEAIKAGG